jgi:structural maintenance of chromosome 3 (chondroitin sulfate proteoglycan 6)
VDSDQTASRVLDVMLRERTGRVTFMPLNRLNPKHPPLPSAQDAIPLLEKLRYDATHDKALQQVFGKTCVCRDLGVAAAYVKSHGINTITLDGDKVDRRGALTGGYHDVRRSRIEAVRGVADWRASFEAQDVRAKEIRAAMLKADQEITQLTGRTQVLINQQQQARGLRDVVGADAAALIKQKERLQERAGKLQEDIASLEGEISGVDAKLAAYRTELASPMAGGLSAEEESEVERLQREVEGLQRNVVEMSNQKNEVRCGPLLVGCGRLLTRAAAWKEKEPVAARAR